MKAWSMTLHKNKWHISAVKNGNYKNLCLTILEVFNQSSQLSCDNTLFLKEEHTNTTIMAPEVLSPKQLCFGPKTDAKCINQKHCKKPVLARRTQH